MSCGSSWGCDGVTYRTLEALREAGVTVALDDFGTGYSSLSYLGRLPIDVIELDRGFMAAVPDLPAQRRLVAGTARLGERLGVCMVAEGIERQAQLTGLVDLGVRLGQGYMLGGPVRSGLRPSPSGWPRLRASSRPWCSSPA